MKLLRACAITVVVVLAAGIVPGASAEDTISGRANFANPSHGSAYLAMRLDRGTTVRICGAGGCQTMITTDYGPKKTTGDIADIALYRFAEICGVSVERARIIGECDVTIEITGDIRLPATDMED